VNPEYPPRINEIRDVDQQLTSNSRCKASISNEAFQVVGWSGHETWAFGGKVVRTTRAGP